MVFRQAACQGGARLGPGLVAAHSLRSEELATLKAMHMRLSRLENTGGDRRVKLIRQLWYILTPRERMEGAFLLCAMVLGAFFETVSIGIVFPFIAVLKEPELLAKSRHFRPLLSHLNISEPRELFFILGLALIALFAIKTGYLILLYRWLFRYAMKKHVNLARQLLAGYLSAPYTLHLQRNSADLIRVTTRSVEDFSNIFMVNLLIALGELLVLGALTSLLMIVEPLATLGALVVLGVPTALVYRSTQHGCARRGASPSKVSPR